MKEAEQTAFVKHVLSTVKGKPKRLDLYLLMCV